MANLGDTSFEQLWKKLLLYAPNCPPIMAQEFVNTAYSRVLGYVEWSGLRADSEFVINAPYATGTIAVTQGSTAVVGTSTVWTAAMAGRQLYVGAKAPYYTIESINTVAQTLVLDRAYGGTTNLLATYSIENIYLVVPTDFGYFLGVRDLSNNWRLHLGFLQEQLDLWDPSRTTTGSPRLLLAAPNDSTGNRRFELWPRSSSATSYPFRYIKKPALMSANSDRPIPPIRGDVIREGALSELSLWPGLPDAPNPFYDQGLSGWKAREARFQNLIEKAELEDQLIRQTIVKYVDAFDVRLAPLDPQWLQTHDPI